MKTTLNCEKDPRWEAEFWKAKAAEYFKELNAIHTRLDGSRADVCLKWRPGEVGDAIKAAILAFTKKWNPEYGVVYAGERSKNNNGAHAVSPFNAELSYLVKMLVNYGKSVEIARRHGGGCVQEGEGVSAEELRAVEP